MCACGKREKNDSVTETEKIWLLLSQPGSRPVAPSPSDLPGKFRPIFFPPFLLLMCLPVWEEGKKCSEQEGGEKRGKQL